MERCIDLVSLEDNPYDYELIEYELKNSEIDFNLRWSDSKEKYTEMLNDHCPDLILADYNVPSISGPEALNIAIEICPEVPFIYVSGSIGEHQAIEVLKQGATDYIFKENLTRLVPAIKRALKESDLLAQKKSSDERQIFTIKILQLLNRHGEETDVIKELVMLIKEFTQFEAVGLRLKEGEDFPYYETKGFPENFIESENHLTARNKTGKIIYNSDGLPILEGMCGELIAGHFDPGNELYTSNGSFFTNSTTCLLESAAGSDLSSNRCDTCNRLGYETVVLVPLKSRNETIGLFHLADQRKDFVSPDMVSFLEGIGTSIGIALERKQFIGKMKDDLDEKTILLKEIHHRVKNNLQLISSILGLQQKSIIDQKDMELFKDCQNRIRSMSMVHEKMYQSESLFKISFSDYAKSFISYLSNVYDIDTSRIKLQSNIDNVCLGVDIAIPCAQIINELVSNAVKYAFPDGKNGTVAIDMYENETYVLKVTDDGIGLSDDLNIENPKSLGFTLLKAFVKQLKGTMEVNTGSGTEITIRFGQP